ncbi:hypothetical protein PsexTeo8_26290 [Pseudomonas extremaustralis]|nr:thiamine pyrophosphate-dependent enzyme [Pseudomonas extremaustralis]MDY7066172.1 hypothetical protein [Pseudomonas extremaustralis]
MAKINLAQQLATTLEQAGIKRIWGLTGDSLNGLTDALGAPVVHAMLDCNTLIMLGTDFPYCQFYPTDAKIIQVDRNPQALGRRTTLDLGIAADVCETINALLPRLTRRTDRSFLDTSLKHYEKARQGLDDLAQPSKANRPIHPQYVARLLSELADDGAIFTAMGILGIRVEQSEDLEPALRRALAHNGPVLVDVVTATQELVMPPSIKLEQAKGFSLYMLKAVMSGRGDEVIELARTNWLR